MGVDEAGKESVLLFCAARKEKVLLSGSTIVILPSHRISMATSPPAKPTTTPSIMKGQRMNQRVAPTRRITSTSRRRV